MEIRVLGPFELVTDDGQVMDVGGHLARALLVALALAEGHRVPTDQLLDRRYEKFRRIGVFEESAMAE